MFNDLERKSILNLVHRSIGNYFNYSELLLVSSSELISEKLLEKRSCFVTLILNGQLRGCIGHLEPIQPLYLDIIENTVGAAFEDNRFLPLTREEFTKVKTEVSVLSIPERIKFLDSVDLLSKIKLKQDGIIIRRGKYNATYLPQVWDDLPDKKEFLSSLCQKAGLTVDDWKKEGMEVWKYRVEKISN